MKLCIKFTINYAIRYAKLWTSPSPKRWLQYHRDVPRLHLLRLSYDLFVYNFHYDFFGIVGGFKLRRMCLNCLRSPYDFFRRQNRTKPYRDLADISRQPQGYRTIIVLTSQIARCPYDDLAEVARSRYADCAIVI